MEQLTTDYGKVKITYIKDADFPLDIDGVHLYDSDIRELYKFLQKRVYKDDIINDVSGLAGYPKKFVEFFFENYTYKVGFGWEHKFNKERPQDRITVEKVFSYWKGVADR
jgi:hypothetical protein